MQRAKSQQRSKVDSHLAGPQSKKFKFTKSEDSQLYNLVKLYGENDWRTIADQMPYRTPRQCRERWTNYVNPNLNKKPWSVSEDMCLIMKHHDFGNKWKIIQRFFPGRSKNDIKQRIKHLNSNMSNDQLSYQNQQSLSQMQIPMQLSSSSPSCEELSALSDPSIEQNCMSIQSYYEPAQNTQNQLNMNEGSPYKVSYQVNNDEQQKPSHSKQKLYLMDIEDLWPPTLQLPMLEVR